MTHLSEIVCFELQRHSDFGHCPLPIKLELAKAFSSTMSKCGQGSKIKQLHRPLPLGDVAFISRLVWPISWLEGEKRREHTLSLYETFCLFHFVVTYPCGLACDDRIMSAAACLDIITTSH